MHSLIARSCVLMGLLAGAVGANTIDFDTFPDSSPVPSGTIITNQYLSEGATFSSTSGGPIATVGLGEASSPPNFLIGNPDSFEPILVDFTGPTSNVEVTLISVGDATVTATAYDAGMSVLSTVSVTNPGTGVGLDNKNPISLSGADVAHLRFEITVSFPGDGFGIDDLEFTPAGLPAVPEPATILLLGGAVLGIVTSRRRRAR